MIVHLNFYTQSTVQLLGDCYDTDDWGGISGDVVKFGLGMVSIIFDIIFMVQHYVFYSPKSPSKANYTSFVQDDDADETQEQDTMYLGGLGGNSRR